MVFSSTKKKSACMFSIDFAWGAIIKNFIKTFRNFQEHRQSLIETKKQAAAARENQSQVTARPLYLEGSVYFTENSDCRSLKNCSCITVFGSCTATLSVGEPLGDVSGSANHDFRTSVTGISGGIDASYLETNK